MSAGPGPLLLWARRCQGLDAPAAAAFLATLPHDQLDTLAADLDALAAAVPAFAAQVPTAALLSPVAGTRAAVRGLGPLTHFLRRCADVDDPLAALFLAAQDRARLDPLADQLRRLRLALRAFRDWPSRRSWSAGPVRDVAAQEAPALPVTAVVLGMLPRAALVPPGLAARPFS